MTKKLILLLLSLQITPYLCSMTSPARDSSHANNLIITIDKLNIDLCRKKINDNKTTLNVPTIFKKREQEQELEQAQTMIELLLTAIHLYLLVLI